MADTAVLGSFTVALACRLHSYDGGSAADHLCWVQGALQVRGNARQRQHAVVQRHQAGPLHGGEGEPGWTVHRVLVQPQDKGSIGAQPRNTVTQLQCSQGLMNPSAAWRRRRGAFATADC